MKRWSLLILLFCLIQPSMAYNTIEIPLLAEYGRGTINAMQWNPAGDVLAVASGKGVWFYDAEFNTLGHWGEDAVNSFKWSETGEYLALLRGDYENCHLQVVQNPLDNPSIAYEETYQASTCNYSLHWLGNSLGFVTNEQIKLIDMDTLNQLFSEAVPNYYSELSISPDGSRLILFGYDTFWLWELETGEMLYQEEMSDTDGALHYLYGAIFWDENYFYISCYARSESYVEYEVCAWDSETGQRLEDFEGISFQLSSDNQQFYMQIISPEDVLFMNLYGDDVGFHWMSREGRLSFPALDDRRISRFVLHPDGETITFGTGNGYLINYSLSENRIVQESLSHTSGVGDMAWHPSDGRLMVLASSQLQVLELDDDERLLDTGIRVEAEDADWVDWSVDGSVLYFGGESRDMVSVAYSYTELNGESYSFIDGWSWQVTGLSKYSTKPYTAISPDMQHIADYIPEENLIRLDNSIEFPVYAILFYWMAWSPNNQFLAASWRDDGEQRIAIWEIATETVIFSENNETVFVNDYLWSADSHYLSYSIGSSDYSQQTIYFIPVLAEEALEPIIIPNYIKTHLIWSPDSQYLLVAGRSMNFYAIPSQELVLSMDGWYTRFDWRADGRYLAGSANGQIFVWDTSALFE